MEVDRQNARFVPRHRWQARRVDHGIKAALGLKRIDGNHVGKIERDLGLLCDVEAHDIRPFLPQYIRRRPTNPVRRPGHKNAHHSLPVAFASILSGSQTSPAQATK